MDEAQPLELVRPEDPASPGPPADPGQEPDLLVIPHRPGREPRALTDFRDRPHGSEHGPLCQLTSTGSASAEAPAGAPVQRQWYPSSCIRRALFDHCGSTFTKSSRWTLRPDQPSIAWRARIPICLIFWPALPDHDPLLGIALDEQVRANARQRAVASPRRRRRTSTAIACGKLLREQPDRRLPDQLRAQEAHGRSVSSSSA